MIQKDRLEEAGDILRRLNIQQNDHQVDRDIAEIKQALVLEAHGWFDLFKIDAIKSRRRVLAVSVNIMQNFSGSRPISYNTTYM